MEEGVQTVSQEWSNHLSHGKERWIGGQLPHWDLSSARTCRICQIQSTCNSQIKHSQLQTCISLVPSLFGFLVWHSAWFFMRISWCLRRFPIWARSRANFSDIACILTTCGLLSAKDNLPITRGNTSVCWGFRYSKSWGNRFASFMSAKPQSSQSWTRGSWTCWTATGGQQLAMRELNWQAKKRIKCQVRLKCGWNEIKCKRCVRSYIIYLRPPPPRKTIDTKGVSEQQRFWCDKTMLLK